MRKVSCWNMKHCVYYSTRYFSLLSFILELLKHKNPKVSNNVFKIANNSFIISVLTHYFSYYFKNFIRKMGSKVSDQ